MSSVLISLPQRSGISDSTSMRGSTTLAHIVLCGASGWAMKYLADPFARPFALGAFTFLVGHSIIGVVRFGHPDSGKRIMRVYDMTSLMAEYLLLPMINLDMYLAVQFPSTVAIGHFIMAVVPLTAQLADLKWKRLSWKQNIVDAFITVNVGSMLYLGITNENVWAIGLSVLTAMNHFINTRVSDRVEVPKSDLVAIGLSFFNVFAIQAINEYSRYSPKSIK